MAVGVEVNEPLALRPWDYPEVTRMLLGSDGSTALLESVAGGRLSAVVDHEEVLAPAAVPTVVREALGIEDPAAPLLLRLTRLVTRERLTVSSDRVYLAARDAKRLLPRTTSRCCVSWPESGCRCDANRSPSRPGAGRTARRGAGAWGGTT